MTRKYKKCCTKIRQSGWGENQSKERGPYECPICNKQFYSHPSGNGFIAKDDKDALEQQEFKWPSKQK